MGHSDGEARKTGDIVYNRGTLKDLTTEVLGGLLNPVGNSIIIHESKSLTCYLEIGLLYLYLSTITFFPSLPFLFRRKTPLSIYCPSKQTTLWIPTDKISLAHWIQGSPVTYRVEPWHSFEFCNIALASACMHRHFSNCSPVFILPLILFSHLSHPP